MGKSYEFNVECDVCRRTVKSTQIKKRWDGLLVCPRDFETRHPLDFYQARNDTHILPFTRPPEAREGTLNISTVTYPLAATPTVTSVVQIGAVPNANFQNYCGPSVTVMAWVRPVLFNGANQNIVANRATGATNGTWAFYLDGTGAPGMSILGKGVQFTATECFCVGKWQHACFVRDNTVSSTKLYKDGILLGGQVALAGYGAIAAPVADPLYIGGNAVGSQDFVGQIRDVRIFSTPLTETQIRQNMQTGNLDGHGDLISTALVPTPFTYLIGWWKMTEGSGTTIADSSGVGFNLTITGTDYSWTEGVF